MARNALNGSTLKYQELSHLNFVFAQRTLEKKVEERLASFTLVEADAKTRSLVNESPAKFYIRQIYSILKHSRR